MLNVFLHVQVVLTVHNHHLKCIKRQADVSITKVILALNSWAQDIWCRAHLSQYQYDVTGIMYILSHGAVVSRAIKYTFSTNDLIIALAGCLYLHFLRCSRIIFHGTQDLLATYCA
ncbi:hypothetical protein G6F26_005520 [Rhizopus arrhizus]|nr:hypothetical protein G6F28_010296 [Rhizopus arrhizus]KAG1024954.1 hypothetical protein G6F26_005520 [Rhizopus arrhizus]KAG1090399.1 hypothetical protein G6F39_010538 [Rhizopus arrhizus]KAG1275443.1 hypothetical protein G6F65_009886 [Rhizopus arrhizus]KAG1336004.1 hypothetical protein G6F63_009835 [Rhizopus arrhizus]